MTLYQLPWAEAQRLRAIITERRTPPDTPAAPSSLEALHQRLHTGRPRARGHA